MFRFVPFERFDALVARLRGHIETGSRAEARDALAVVLGLHGLRVTEVCRLSIGDLDQASGKLDVASLSAYPPPAARAWVDS
jgi:hypothetical protein